MIVTKMTGGLGNQMFQYAAGLSASLRLKTELYIDNVQSINDRTHSYNLSVFDIKADILPASDISVNGREVSVKGKKLFYYKQEKFNYDKSFEHIADNTYIDGFFQSEKFFIGIEKRLAQDFTLLKPAEGKNASMLDMIKSCESVSLHIRRGDYFDNWKNRLFHGVNLFGYYKKALKIMNEKLKNPVYFIFSDDPSWVKKNFTGIKEPVTVDINDSSNGHEDLRLMSACRHNIIANSTFSWWGAWLNGNPDKTVIAPKKWFNNPFVDTSDVIPKSWLRL